MASTTNRYITGGVSDLSIGISVASQLPGRHSGGPADALRHLVLSAELTRRFGADNARKILDAHEVEDTNTDRSDTRHDRYINKIGTAIGAFLRTRGGTTHDAIELCLQAVEESLSAYSWKDAGLGGAWKRNADGFYVPPLDGVDLDFKGAVLRVPPVGLTDNSKWEKNPRAGSKKNDARLTHDQSNWPGADFRHSFVFEPENAALTYTDTSAPPQWAIDAAEIYGSVRGAIQGSGPRSAPNRLRFRGPEIKSDGSQSLMDTYIRNVTRAGLAWDGRPAEPGDTPYRIAGDVATRIGDDRRTPTSPRDPERNIRGTVAQTIGGWGAASYLWNAPHAEDGKTVGQAILDDPAEFEKFLAVNAKALVETSTQHGLNFTEARKQLDAEWSRLAKVAGEARHPGADAEMPWAIKDEISTRAYQAGIDGESYTGNPDAIDRYRLLRGHNGEPSGWSESLDDGPGNAVRDPLKIDALNRRRKIRIDWGTGHPWQGPDFLNSRN